MSRESIHLLNSTEGPAVLGSGFREGGRRRCGYGSVQGQNKTTRRQGDSIIVFCAPENPHTPIYRLIDRGNGECWLKWVKEEVGYSVQATAPEQKLARAY